MSILDWLRRGVSRTASRQRAGRLNVRRLHVELLEERCVLTPVVSVLPIAPQEGAHFSGPVATFTDSAATGPAQYTALINWDDGSAVQTVTPTGPTNGVFTVSGSHTYTEEKGYTVTVTVTNATQPDSWTTEASLPTARTLLTAAAGANGQIYAIGGKNSLGVPIATVEGYNPATNTWTTEASMPAPRWEQAAAAGPNGLIYVFGGNDSIGHTVSTVYGYNPATNSWATEANMPTARILSAAAPGPNGLIYVFGGDDSVGNTLSTVEAYNPATNTWTTEANMPTARFGLMAATGANGLIYVFGGTNILADKLATVEAYNPATNTWTTEANMPTGRELAAAALGPNGQIYVMGGFNNSGELSTTEAYNPATNTWTTVTSMPTAREQLAAAPGLNGLIYAIGGDNINGILSTVEALNINTGIGSTPITVIDQAPVVSVLPITPQEGALFSGAVATITDPGGNEAAANYAATINWGDGSGTDTITPSVSLVNGQLTVSGRHTYTEEGTYTITVRIHHDTATPQTVSLTATVSDPPVAATGGFTLTAVEGTDTGVQTLATFTDPGGPGDTEYTATINWGDTLSDTATLTNGGIVDLGTVNGAESFAVKGHHTYISSGSLTLNVSIQHAALAPVVVNDVANVANVRVPPPSSLSLDPGSDSGPPNITNVRTPTFNGTAPAGTTVTLFSDAVAVGSGPVTDGTFHITTSPLPDGVHQITAQATDANGHVSPLSGTLAVTIDATPPTSAITFPTATTFSTTTWTGAVTGTATDNLSGVAAIQVSVFDSTANTSFDGTGFVASSTPLFVAATGTTSWSLPLPASALTVGDSYTISSQAKDVAGNVRTLLTAIAFTFSSGTPPAKSPTQDKVAAFSPDGTWTLDLGGNGTNVVTVVFGLPGDRPITGDWNGAGFDEIGTVRVDPNAFAPDGNHALLWSFDINGNNQWDSGDRSFIFGEQGDQIVLGDWNGDGKTKVGVVRADANGVLVWSLDYSGNYATTGQYTVYHYGLNGDQVVSGDWTGDGTDKIGVTRANLSVTLADGSHPMLWVLNYPGNGVYNGSFFTFGASYDALLLGDWTGDGKTKVGVAAADPNGVGADIALDLDSNGVNNPNTANFAYGLVGDVFIRGDWNADGTDKIGVARSSGPATLSVTLDGNGNHGFGAVFSLPGQGSDTILVGSWKP